MKHDFWESLTKVTWALLLVCLPFTSFPAISRLFGGTSVAPLSAVFLVILLVIFMIPYGISHRSIPRQSLPLIIFVILALVATAFGNFLSIPSFRDIPAWRNSLEGLITIFVGVGFYLVTTLIIRDTDMLKSTLRWINLGGLVIIIVSLVQALSWLLTDGYPQFLWQIQPLFTSNGLLYAGRVNGVAFEPSWLAHQLNTLYIPLWLGLSVKRFSCYKRKLFNKISFENVLLALGLIVLFLSFSRIGWLTAIFMIAFVIFHSANKLMNTWLSKHYEGTGKKNTPAIRFLTKLGLWLVLLVLFALVILLIGMVLTHIDPRMVQLFDIERYRKYGILGWASQLGFAERIIYWMAAFRVFLNYPWFGVGIGGTGYFFPAVVPEFGFKLPEIIRAAGMDTFIPNAKNLWVRLLGETGIIGFTFFVSWVFIHWRDAAHLDKDGQPSIEKACGYAGKLFILALIVEGFSMDTFGLPYYWIALGLIAATKRLSPPESSVLLGPMPVETDTPSEM
ncbi:MAG: O-antigen ligase family protein [Anaerolineaceae bacterium]